MEFYGLSKNYCYALESIIFRRCSIKAITWNSHVESHFYNNKYNPISKRGEPKFKAINLFSQSILLHRF